MEALSLAKKISNVQTAVGSLKKGANNPFYSSKYIDINGVLEALHPILQKEGLTVVQPLTHVEGQPAIKTVVMDTDSEATIESVTVMPLINDPQKAGGAITYFRRYSLISLFSLGAEDDDANAASGLTAKKSASKGDTSKATRKAPSKF